MLRATLIGSFIALASGQGSATCTITGSINSYPSVRRSGTSANSYSPAPHFDAIIAGFGAMDAFVSDVGLNWIDIIRTSEVDEGFNGWGKPNCAHAPQCGVGISNATVAGNIKKDYLEEHDVVSFDVFMESNSNAFQIPFVIGELKQGSTLYVKIGCTSSTCDTWSGVGGANMFNAFQWIVNDGTPQVGASPASPGSPGITATFNSNPDASVAEGAPGGHHVELSVDSAAPVDIQNGVCFGTILATVIGPPQSTGQMKIKTFSSDNAFQLTDTRCIGSNSAEVNGESNMLFITYPPPSPPPPPPPPPSPPPPLNNSPCSSDDSDSDGNGSDSGDDGDSAASASDSGSGSNSASSDSGSSDSGSGSSAGSSNGDSGSGRRLDGDDDSNSNSGSDGNGSDGDSDGSNGNGSDSDSDDCDDDSDGNDSAGGDDDADDDGAASSDSGSGSNSGSSNSGSGSASDSSDGDSKDGGGGDDDTGSGN